MRRDREASSGSAAECMLRRCGRMEGCETRVSEVSELRRTALLSHSPSSARMVLRKILVVYSQGAAGWGMHGMIRRVISWSAEVNVLGKFECSVTKRTRRDRRCRRGR